MIESLPKHKRTKKYRLYEKVPAIISLGSLLLLVIGGIFFPEVTSYVVIIIDVFFLYKSGMLAVTFIIAFFRIRTAEAIDWQLRLKALEDPEAARNLMLQEKTAFENIKQVEEIPNGIADKLPQFFHKLLLKRERKKIIAYYDKELADIGQITPLLKWRDVQHVIIIPHVKEPEHILRETLEIIRNQNFPLEQINIVLAAEARDEEGYQLSLNLAKEYSEIFNHVWVSKHVLGDDEIIGKSSNMKAGGIVAYNEVTALGWDLKKTLVTSCDADSKLPKEYFAYVTYKYVTTPDQEYKFFNAAMVFYNNIWRLPFYARVKNSISSLYNTARMVRTDKLIPFSTYTTSFWVIQNIGFWTPWVTPEDFHLFLKAQFTFGKRISVIPIYLRIMSDAAEGSTHLDTIKNNYMQERRWSWGVSDDGWVIQNIIAGIGKMDLTTIYRSTHSLFDHVISPVMGIFLMIGGNLPTLFNPAFSYTSLGAQAPRVSSLIITVSTLFLIILIIMDIFYKPTRKSKHKVLSFIGQLLEWLILPYASFIMSVIPGIEANTRLLIGKHLEYYVTKKK